MKVTYIGPSADLDIGVAVIRRDPVTVESGFDDEGNVIRTTLPAVLTVDVDDELAKSLIESGDFVAEKKTKTEEATS